jgi:hypothetical protein
LKNFRRACSIKKKILNRKGNNKLFKLRLNLQTTKLTNLQTTFVKNF